MDTEEASGPFFDLVMNVLDEMEREEKGKIIPKKEIDPEISKQTKLMREAYNYDDLAWFLIYHSLLETENDDFEIVIEKFKDHVAKIWKNDTKQKLKTIGIKSKNDIVTMYNAMVDHKMVYGDKESYIQSPNDALF